MPDAAVPAPRIVVHAVTLIETAKEHDLFARTVVGKGEVRPSAAGRRGDPRPAIAVPLPGVGGERIGRCLTANEHRPAPPFVVGHRMVIAGSGPSRPLVPRLAIPLPRVREASFGRSETHAAVQHDDASMNVVGRATELACRRALAIDERPSSVSSAQTCILPVRRDSTSITSFFRLRW